MKPSIIDQFGNPMMASTSLSSPHYGASVTAPGFGDWRPFGGSADADLLFDRDTLVSRSRDLIRNEGLASGQVTTFVDNVLGSLGLKLQANVDWQFLGWTEERAEQWNEAVEGEFRAWADGPDFECDAAESSNLRGLAVLSFRGVLSSGDHGVLPLWLPDPRRRYATALQLVESDRLSTPPTAADGPRMRAGVEINDRGAPVAYHVRSTHPGDVLLDGAVPTWERIEAKTAWGRRRFIHLIEPERVGQRRGKPNLSAILGEHRQFGELKRAELDAAVTNAMIAAILEAPLDGATIMDLFSTGSDYVKMRNEAAPVTLRRNSVIRTLPGEKLSSFNPGRPNASFAAFSEMFMRIMAAGLNLPYELLAKDFSKSNYSSARAALLEAWRHFMCRREFMATYFYQPIYALWLEEAVNQGRVVAPGFYENRAAYLRADWIGPGRGWIDPYKEALASDARQTACVSSFAAECAEQGGDWRDTMRQIAREQRLARSLGIVIPSMVPALEGAVRRPLPPPDATETRDDKQP